MRLRQVDQPSQSEDNNVPGQRTNNRNGDLLLMEDVSLSDGVIMPDPALHHGEHQLPSDRDGGEALSD